MQFRQSDSLVWCFDETASEEFDGLGGIFSVADVGTLDGNHLDDGLEDWCAEIGAGWKTNANNGTARTDVLPNTLTKF